MEINGIGLNRLRKFGCVLSPRIGFLSNEVRWFRKTKIHMFFGISFGVCFILLSNGTGVVMCAAPITFSNIEVTVVKDTSVVIQWDTDVVATGQVEYGLGAGYGNLTEIEDLSYWHSIEVTGLIEGTTYHYRIRAKNRKGNGTVSNDYTFTTYTMVGLEEIVRAARFKGDLPKVYYVTTDGNDETNDGLSPEDAFATIQKCADIMEAGDTCMVHSGTYDESIQIFSNDGIPTHRISFIGENYPVVKSSASFVFGVRRDCITIQGFKVQASGSTDGIQLGVGGSGARNAQNFVISNNIITTDDPGGSGGHGIKLSVMTSDIGYCKGGTIKDNVISADAGALVLGGISTEAYHLKICNNILQGGLGDDGGGGLDYGIGFYSLKGNFVDIVQNNLSHSGWTGLKIHSEKCVIKNNDFSDKLCHNFIDGYGPNEVFFFNNYIHNMDKEFCTRANGGWYCTNNCIYNSGVNEDKNISLINTTIEDCSGRGITLGGNMHDVLVEGLTIKNFEGRAIQLGAVEEQAYPWPIYSSRNITFKNIKINGSGYHAILIISLGTCTSEDHTDWDSYIPDDTTFINVNITGDFTNTWQLSTHVAYPENHHFDGTVYVINSNRDDVLFTKASEGTHNGVIIFYYYIDVKVVDKEMHPVSDAKVSFISNDPVIKAKNLLPVSTPYAGETEDIDYTYTGLDGHTPFPTDPSSTVAIADFKESISETKEFEWTITAEKNGYMNSVSVNPDSSWYRQDPNISNQTITVILPFILPPTIVDKILVFPNPYIKGKGEEIIRFSGLPDKATIRIYTIAGELIKTIEHQDSVNGTWKDWDISKIASGVYIYSVISPYGNKEGKMSILK